MKFIKIALLIFVLPLIAFTTVHKYYVSVTKIEYVKEKQAVQIISRVFIDDFERLLRERFDDKITLNIDDESKSIDLYSERYIKDKLKIEINGETANLNYLGKEYEDDIIYFYLEIEGVKNISSFHVSNSILIDLFAEQQNVVRTHINSKHKSFILTKANNKGVLNFN